MKKVNLVDKILSIIKRDRELFAVDIGRIEPKLSSLVNQSSFLVIGGAGTIGQAVVKEIFKRAPGCLDVVDISENNLVELIRDIRSSLGYIKGGFRTLPLDCGSIEFETFFKSQQPYDYILNLSALKHVRSEKDPYTLMQMIKVNVLNTDRILKLAFENGCRKYFGVSTDKAVNPVNAMGASKSVMEMCMMQASEQVSVSSARFANVAFSDGSLLHGFTQRIRKRQPFSAPRDVKRYFMTATEAGQLCLISCLMGKNREIMFPKYSDTLQLTDFPTIATNYLNSLGFEPYICKSEDEARSVLEEMLTKKMWPCYFFDSDTTGEKSFEEFYTEHESVDLDRFEEIGIIKKSPPNNNDKLSQFIDTIENLRNSGSWTRKGILDSLSILLPTFLHKETRKFLDSRM